MPFLFGALLLTAHPVGAEGPPDWDPAWETLAESGYARQEAEAIAGEHLEKQAFDAARPWYRAAARAGSPRAAAHMGWIYEGGHGVPIDGGRAVTWYERAFEAGADHYALHLAWMHLEGGVLETDRETADAWFQRAIDSGLPEARVAYGSVRLSDYLGGGDAEAAEEAHALFEEAWETEGITQAAYFLGRMHLEGLGVERAVEEGAAYIRAGAEAGDPELQGRLAALYQSGTGLTPDSVRAMKWATLAALRDDPRGERLRQRLEESLEPDAQSRAEALAWEWIAERRSNGS